MNLNHNEMCLFEEDAFLEVYKVIYDEVLTHLLSENDQNSMSADELILSFYDMFENSKKMIVFESDNDTPV